MKQSQVVVIATVATVAFLVVILTYGPLRRKQQPKLALQSEQLVLLEQILATKPDYFADEGVAKITIDRPEIKTQVLGHELTSFTGLFSWISFQQGQKKGVEVMIMGDILLLEHEVNPALYAALDNQIDITALHNHYVHDQPKLYYMHINAEGSLRDVAQGVKHILDAVQTAKEEALIMEGPSTNTITASIVEDITGEKPLVKEGMAKVVVGRKIHAGCGCTIGKNMGVNTWAAFFGTDDNAVVYGDFVVFEQELQPLLHCLRQREFAIFAIHNHMTFEHPRCIFVHYWASGPVKTLAQHIKDSLDTIAHAA